MENRDKVLTRIEELKKNARTNDPVVACINKLLRTEYGFNSPLRVLPLQLVEQYGPEILDDKKKFNEVLKPEYDVFNKEWQFHYSEFWKDILNLLDAYQKADTIDRSPFESFNYISDLMIKCERRALLLNIEPKHSNRIVMQKQKRLDGSEKQYKFLRAYWIDTDGSKKRMDMRLIGDRYSQVEKEVADLFHNRGFAVHRQYRSPQGNKYDMVIEREGMKTAVEVKRIKEDTFYDLFLFDELQKKFKDEYGMK